MYFVYFDYFFVPREVEYSVVIFVFIFLSWQQYNAMYGYYIIISICISIYSFNEFM